MSSTPQTGRAGATREDADDGRALAMTVFSLLRPGGVYVQRLVYAYGRRSQAATVRGLSFIHFARLALVEEFPSYGQVPENLPHPLQLFESNYNGSFAQYIDTFVAAIPRAMRGFWLTSYGFPCRLPLGPFKQYISANQFGIDHYYVANPDATVTMIGSALRVARANAQFLLEAKDLPPDVFAERFWSVIRDIQQDL